MLDGRKMKNCMKKASGQGLFRRNSETAERFRILFFALQAGVVTQLFQIDFMRPSTFVELRRDRKMKIYFFYSIGQGLFRCNSETVQYLGSQSFALRRGVVTHFAGAIWCTLITWLRCGTTGK